MVHISISGVADLMKYSIYIFLYPHIYIWNITIYSIHSFILRKYLLCQAVDILKIDMVPALIDLAV